MQKKVLASLLVTPLAFNALADITFEGSFVNNGDGWDQSGITGDLNVFTGESVNCPIGSGVLKTTLKNSVGEGKFYPGTYKIQFASTDNISVKVNGSQCDLTDNTVEFKLDETTNGVSLEITAQNAGSAFSFSNMTLALVVNFKEIRTPLWNFYKTQLETPVNAITIPDDYGLEDKDELTSTLQNLKNKVNGQNNLESAKSQFTELNDKDEASFEVAMNAYAKWELWRNPNKMQEEFDALKKEIDEFATKVSTQTSVWETVKTNTAAKDSYLDKVKALKAALTEATKDLSQDGYVYGSIKTDVDAITGAITAWETEITTAYADLTKEGITVSDQESTISGQIEALTTAISEAADDESAYNTLMGLQQQLVTEAQKAREAIDALKGIEGQEANFDSDKEEVKTKVTGIYTQATSDVVVKQTSDIAGAAEHLDSDSDILNKAIKDIQTTLQEISSKVNEQNTAYTNALNEVTTRQSSLDGIAYNMLLPEDADTEFKNLRKEAQDAIDTLKNKIEDAYKNGNVEKWPEEGTSYADDFSDIDTKIGNLKDFNAKWAPITNLSLSLEILKAEVKAIQEKSEIPTTEFDLSSKYAGTYTSIDNAIKDLSSRDYTEAELTAVSDRIDAIKADAQKLMDAYVAAARHVTEFSTKLGELDGYIESKEIFEGSTWNNDTFKSSDSYNYKTLKETHDSYKTTLSQIQTADGQQAYLLATELSGKFNSDTNPTGYDVEAEVNKVLMEYEVSATNANWDVVSNAVETVRAASGIGNSEVTYAGKEEEIHQKILDLDPPLNEAKTDIDNASKETVPNVETFNGIDSDLKELLSTISTLTTRIEELKTNQANYNTLIAKFDPAIQDAINALILHNEATSQPPAKEYYAGVINGTTAEDKSLQQRADNLKTEMSEALHAYKICTDEQFNTLNGKISALLGDIEKMTTDITTNETTHTAQLTTSATVRDLITSSIARLQQADTDAGSTLTTDWQAELTAYLDDPTKDDLTEIDLDVNKFYGQGASVANNDDIIRRYGEITAKVNEIMQEYADKFDDRVSQTIDQIVQEAGWETTKASVSNAAKEAILQYNKFLSLTNDRYRTFILKVVKTHESIFGYDGKLASLDQEVSQWIESKKTGNKVITADEFKTEATDKATALIDKISDIVDAMMADANAAAKAFYNGGEYTYGSGESKTTDTVEPGIYTEANNAISTAKETLKGAGVSDQTIATVFTDADTELQAGVDSYTQNEADVNLCLEPMNFTAERFAEIKIDDTFMHKALLAQWNADYTAAKTTLDNLTEELNGYVNSTDASVSELASYVTAANNLDTTAKADTDLLANLKTHQTQLAGIVKDAQDLVSEKKKASEADQANQEKLAEYTATIDRLKADYATLVAFTDGISGGNAVHTDAISELIENVETLVNETYNHTLVQNQSSIDAAIEAVNTAISNGYTTAKDNEIVALNGLLSATRVAHNNASVYSDTLTDADLDADRANITSYETRIAQLNGVAVPDDKDGFSAEAQELEQSLADLYVKLMSSFYDENVGGGDPVPAIKQGLEERYNTVSSIINDGITSLQGCVQSVQDQFAGEYDKLSERLEAVKAEWEEDNNKVVLNNDSYMNTMKSIETAATELAEEIKNAQQAAEDEAARVQANSDAYTRLQGQLTTYQEQADALRTTVENYNLTEDLDIAYHFGLLDAQFESTATWLEDANSAVSLTAETTLQGEANIKSELEYLSKNAESKHAQSLQSSANQALSDARLALTASVVPDEYDRLNKLLNGTVDEEGTIVEVGLTGRYNTNVAALTQLEADYNAGTTDLETYLLGVADIIAEFEAIASEANDIKAEAEENTFLRGDVDNDKEVTTADLQTLIGWVGQRVDYDALKEASPRQAAAADMNSDGRLNIADATSLLQVIIDTDNAPETTSATPRLVSRKGVRTGESLFSLTMAGKENGSRDYVMTLDNAETFIGGQMDLKLPAGMTLADVRLDSRAADHEVMTFDNGNGEYRLIILSMTNSAIQGNGGVLLHLTIDGVGNPVMDNVIFSDTEMNAIGVRQSGTSLLDTIVNDARNVKDTIYNVAGQTMRGIQRGINIIRHSDGTVTKESH